MQFTSRDEYFLPHPSVDVYSEDLKVLTAIAMAARTCVAGFTVHVGLDCTAVPRPQAFHPRSNFQHLHSKFVARDSWVREERELTEISRIVGPTNTYSVYT